jgi:hypothetical protein
MSFGDVNCHELRNVELGARIKLRGGWRPAIALRTGLLFKPALQGCRRSPAALKIQRVRGRISRFSSRDIL